jgi:hypothetical protein
MNELEIELEIQKRVEFKMNEFKTALKNRVHFKWQDAFREMSLPSQYIWQAFQEIEKMIQKEVEMPLPIKFEHGTMLEQSKWEAKEKAVKEMRTYLDELRNNYFRTYNINQIVSIIEKSQNYL